MAHAQIYSNTSASSQTGGNVVGAGGNVETGDASASVTTSNVSGKSSSSVYIKTDVNGVVYEESHSSDSGDVSVEVTSIPAGVVVETREGASAPVRRTVTEVPATLRSDIEPPMEATSSAQATSTLTTEEEAGLGTQIVLAVQSFFAGLFSWFK